MNELQKEEKSIETHMDKVEKLVEKNYPDHVVFFTFINKDDEEKGEYSLYMQAWREKGGVKDKVADAKHIFVFSDKEEREEAQKRIGEKYLGK